MHTAHRATMIVVAAMLVGTSKPLSGQEMHQQGIHQTQQQQMHQQMQQQMANMQGMMQRMGVVIQHSQHVSQGLAAQAHQMSPGQMQQHQSLQRMSDHITTMGQHVQGVMEQMHRMLSDPELMRSPDMHRDIQEMQRQMGATVTGMEKSLQALERMAKRMGVEPRKP